MTTVQTTPRHNSLLASRTPSGALASRAPNPTTNPPNNPFQSESSSNRSQITAHSADQADSQRPNASASETDSDAPSFDETLAAWFSSSTLNAAASNSASDRAAQELNARLGTNNATNANPAHRSSKSSSKADDAARSNTDANSPSAATINPVAQVNDRRPVLDAQRTLAGEVDIADRAAAELRGESDQDTANKNAYNSENESSADERARNANDARSARSAQAREASTNASVTATANSSSLDAASARGSSDPSAKSFLANSAGTSAYTAASANDDNSTSNQGNNPNFNSNSNPNSRTNTIAATGSTSNQNSNQNSNPTTNSSTSASANIKPAPAANAPPAPTAPGLLGGQRDPLRMWSTASSRTNTSKNANAATNTQQPLPTDDPAAFTSQVARGLAAAVRQREGTLTLRISPDSLGPLKIEVRVQDGRVSARIDADSPQARQLLNSTHYGLRSALEAQGLIVDRITVVGAERTASSKPNASRDRSTDPLRDSFGASNGNSLRVQEPDPRAQGGAQEPTLTASRDGTRDSENVPGFTGDSAPGSHQHAHDNARNDSNHDNQLTVSALASSDAIDQPSPQSFSRFEHLSDDLGNWHLRVDVLI